MYDYVVVGGGIESFLFCFFILSDTKKTNIAFVTKSPDDMSEHSSLSKIGVRHVSTSEYVNFLSRFFLKTIIRRPFLGGSNGINKTLNKYEVYWLKKRFQLGIPREFSRIIDNKLKTLSLEGVSLWKTFLSSNPDFFLDVDLIRGIYKVSNQFEGDHSKLNPLNLDDMNEGLVNRRNVSFESDAFSFNSLKLCRKIADFLSNNRVDFFHNTEISEISFTPNRKLKYVVSSCGKIFKGKNYFFSIGANFFGHNDYFDLRKVTQPTRGMWFLVHDTYLKYPTKYCHYINSDLAFYQNYTPVDYKSSVDFAPLSGEDGKNSVVVGTGYIWVRSKHGASYLNRVFVENNERIIKALFPGKKITLIDDSCIRNCSYNGLPVFRCGKSLDGKYLSVSGSGTFTTAAAVASARRAANFLGNLIKQDV